MSNQIYTIMPYYLDELATWVFDDPAKDLDREPFVAGIPEMIELITDGFENRRKGFGLLFSDGKFVEKNWRKPMRFARLTFFEAEEGGAWYVGKYEGQHMEGWLCPALMKYFPEPPLHIYIAVFPISAETQPSPEMRELLFARKPTKDGNGRPVI